MIGIFFIMFKYKYLNYYTEFSCEGSISVNLDNRVCFREAFDKIKKDYTITYKVILYPSPGLLRDGYANDCLFTKHEIRNHLRQLKSLYPLSYCVRSAYHKNHDVIIVTLRLNKVPVLFHKYALTWLRYTYEYPYNVILRDAYKLKKDPMFRFESIATLFNVVSSSFPGYVGDGHSIHASEIHIPLKVSELRLSLSMKSYLRDIYDYHGYYYKIPIRNGNYRFDCSEYWTDEHFENSRKPIYIESYKEMIKRR